MKGSTARAILKIYRITGVTIITILIGGSAVYCIYIAFKENWKIATGFFGAALLLAVLFAIGIEAEVNKDKKP